MLQEAGYFWTWVAQRTQSSLEMNEKILSKHIGMFQLHRKNKILSKNLISVCFFSTVLLLQFLPFQFSLKLAEGPPFKFIIFSFNIQSSCLVAWHSEYFHFAKDAVFSLKEIKILSLHSFGLFFLLYFYLYFNLLIWFIGESTNRAISVILWILLLLLLTLPWQGGNAKSMKRKLNTSCANVMMNNSDITPLWHFWQGTTTLSNEWESDLNKQE